jgi:thioesterase domain-containing protein/acyl carrier protein
VDSGSQPQLHGFFSLRDYSQPISPAELRRFAAEQLAHYKVPVSLTVVAQMPLTASGKVDRKRLPDHVPEKSAVEQFIAPETALEKFLAEGWCHVLQTDRISVDQNFFDAGGSSLQAAMLTSELSQSLGVHVPTAMVFDLADISQVAIRLCQLYPDRLQERFGADCVKNQLAMANTISRGRRSDTGQPMAHDHPLLETFGTSIFDIQCHERHPVFMVHPPGGIVACYRELARSLHPEQSLIAIRARGLHGHEQLPDTIQAMAADYVRSLQAVQPNGPYTLGGWSLGGLVAYEMAQQLVTSGHTLAALILLDTTIPEGATNRVPASELVQVGMEYGIELTLDELGELAPEEQLSFLWEHAKKLGVLEEDSPAEVVTQVLRDLQNLFHHHVELAIQYRMQPLQGHIRLYRPTEVPFELQVSADRGWRHLAQSVEVHFVPGHHHSMVQPPHVKHLADRLRTDLK